MFLSPADDTDLVDIVTDVLQVIYVYTLSRLYTSKKVRSRWYPAETMTNADYTNNQALLENTPTPAETQEHSK